MSNEVLIVIKARNDTKKVMDAAERDAKQRGHDIGKGLTKGISDEVDKESSSGSSTSKAAGKVGDQAGKSFGEKLGARLRDEKGKFASALSDMGGMGMPKLPGTEGGAGGGIPLPIKPHIPDRDRQSFLSRLGEMATKGAVEMADKLGNGLVKAFQNSDEKLMTALVGSAVLVSPVLGAVISGAIVGGAGIGGVVGGVLLAVKDSRVQGAGQDLGKTLMGDLANKSSVFLEPVLKVIATIEDRWKSMGGTISGIFQKASQWVEPLAGGIMDMIEGILTGLNEAFGQSGPVIGAWADAFGILGNSIGNVFVILSGGAEDSAAAITNFAQQLGLVLEVTAWVIRGLTELYGVVQWGTDLIGSNAGPILEYFKGKQDAVTQSNRTAIPTFSELASKVKGASAAAIDYAANAAAVVTANQNLYSTTTNAAQAIADASKKIKANADMHDLNSQKTRDNRNALSTLATALSRNYDAYVKVNGAGDGANGVMESNRKAFIRAAEKAGYAAQEARELADALLGIKSRTVNVNVIYNESRRTKNDRQTGDRGLLAAGGVAGGNPGYAASGANGGRMWVGELGPELVDLPVGSKVRTAGDSARIATGATAPGWGGVLVVQTVLDGKVLAEEMIDPQRDLVNRRYGGNVQAAYGRGY